MTAPNNTSRRTFLKTAGDALAALPIIMLSTNASAARNDTIRKALSYQTSPKDGKSCSVCKNYVPAKNGCTMFPGDTEIVATGYCTGFIAKT